MTRPTYGDAAVADEVWAEYQELQVTARSRAAARERAEQRAEHARSEGVYERAREIAGTVKWSLSWQDLRIEE